MQHIRCFGHVHKSQTSILQIHYHVLKVLYLLPCVSSTDLAVGHCAVFGGGEVVEGFLEAGCFHQRQGGVAWAGVLMKAILDVKAVFGFSVHLKRPVARYLGVSARKLFWHFFPVQSCAALLINGIKEGKCLSL